MDATLTRLKEMFPFVEDRVLVRVNEDRPSKRTCHGFNDTTSTRNSKQGVSTRTIIFS